MKAGYYDPDRMALALPQPLGQNVGLIASFLYGREDPGFRVRMNIGSIVKRPGNGAYVNTGQSCNIF